jgi:hypothetical protein
MDPENGYDQSRIIRNFVMGIFCSVCGKELVKSNGPIGPTCLRRLKPKNLRKYNSNSAYIKMFGNQDFFGEDKDGQKQDGSASQSPSS